VYELLTALLALELALPEEEILKHVRLMQYQLRVFKNVHSLFHVIAQALFTQGRDVVVS